MNVFRKIKLEITIVLLVILGIAAFFIYGKVLEVQQLRQQEEKTRANIEALLDIKGELERMNCMLANENDPDRKAKCAN